MISSETHEKIGKLFNRVKELLDHYDPDYGCDDDFPEVDLVLFLHKLYEDAHRLYNVADYEHRHLSKEDKEMLKALNGPGSPFAGLIEMPPGMK